MGYFASRSAPMGAVSTAVVTAVFHNFRPAMVARAIPDAWDYSSPERALAARTAVADSALRRLWGDLIDSADLAEAAVATMEIARGLRGEGRPLYTPTAALDEPDAPHLKLGMRARSFANIDSTATSRRSRSTVSTGWNR